MYSYRDRRQEIPADGEKDPTAPSGQQNHPVRMHGPAVRGRTAQQNRGRPDYRNTAQDGGCGIAADCDGFGNAGLRSGADAGTSLL